MKKLTIIAKTTNEALDAASTMKAEGWEVKWYDEGGQIRLEATR